METLNFSLVIADKKSPNLYALWSDEQGQHKVSTRTTDRKIATQRAPDEIRKWYGRQQRKGAPLSPPPQIQTNTQAQAQTKTQTQTGGHTKLSPTMRLDDLAEAYIAMRPELRDTSKKKLRDDVIQFCTYAEVNPRICDITDELIVKWKSGFLKRVQERQKLDRMPTTTWGLHTAYTDLAAMCNWLVEEGEIERNPFRNKLKPAQPQRDPAGRAWEEPEVIKMLMIAIERSKHLQPNSTGNKVRMLIPYIIRLGLLTGARTIELLNLKWANFGENVIRFTDTKTKRDREFQTNDNIKKIYDELQEYYKQRPGQKPTWVFEGILGRKLCYNTVVYHLQAIRKEAGFAPRIGGKRYTLYETRHTTAVNLLTSGIDDQVVANVLGHKDASMVRKVYGKYSTREIPTINLPTSQTE